METFINIIPFNTPKWTNKKGIRAYFVYYGKANEIGIEKISGKYLITINNSRMFKFK